MRYFKRTDLIHKYLTSVLFRIILLSYSFFLISIQDNIFDFYIYIIYFFVYIAIYIYLLIKKWAVVRTVNDYILIFIILLFKNIYLPYNIIFLLIPLFNSPNHTSEKRNNWFLFLFTIILFLLLHFKNPNHSSFDTSTYFTLVAILVLTIISHFELSRARLFKDTFNIYQDIDDVAKKANNTTMIPEIYKLIISKIKEKFNIDIKQITCFEVIKGKAKIKNSSLFVYSSSIDSIDIKSNLNINPLTTKININGQEVYNILTVKIDKFIFLFISDNENTEISIRNKLYIYEVVLLIFEKIVNIIENEEELFKQKQKQNKVLTSKQHYVLEIMKSTHFISNKLGPIKNFLTLQTDYDNGSFKMYDKDAYAEIRKVKKEETKRAKTSLKKISEKIDLLLNKDANPFIPTSVISMKYKAIFMHVKRIWLIDFSENDIKIKNATDTNVDIKIVTNNEVLELIFTDLLTNMTKYSAGSNVLTFDFSKDLRITLANKIKDFSIVYKTLDKTVNDFNNNNKLEINKRNSFGLPHVRELCEQLNIDTILKIDVKKELFITELSFKGNV